jgi:hypothetical protein
MVEKGRKTVRIIAAVYIATSAVGFFVNLFAYYFFGIAFVIFLLQFGVAVAMARGWSLARYFMAVYTFFWMLASGLAVFSGELPLWMIPVFVPILAYYSWASVHLFTCKSVCEYMYEMNEGW